MAEKRVGVRVRGFIRWAARLALLALALALLQDPHSVAVREALARAEAALRVGRPAEAFAAYQVALQAQPGDVAIIERLYEAARAAYRPDLAALYLRQAAALHGWTPDRYRKMAALYDAQGDATSALAFWQASLVGSPEDIPALRHLADAAIRGRRWAAASDTLGKIVALDPAESDAWYRLGLLLAPKNARLALNCLNRVALQPAYREAYRVIDDVFAQHGNEPPAALAFRLGLAMIRLGEWPYAEHALTIAVSGPEVNPVAFAFLGLAQEQGGHTGWPALRRALELAPSDATVNYAVGVYWRLKGDAGQALAALRLAHAVDPQNAAIAAELGMVYRASGHLAEAAEWLRRAVALAPDEAGFRALLAVFYADENFDLPGEGLAMIREIALHMPEDADVLASLGWALLSTEAPEAAREALQDALRIAPSNIRARYYFGVLLEYQGDTTGALEAYLYVYREDRDAGFRERAARALVRLGYEPGGVARSFPP